MSGKLLKGRISLVMAEEKLSLMEMAIMDAMRQEGMIERSGVGYHCRKIIDDWDAAGPMLWTEKKVREWADILEGMVNKGYLTWVTYLLQVGLTEKGKKYIDDNKEALDDLPKVDDGREWFKQQTNKKMYL